MRSLRAGKFRASMLFTPLLVWGVAIAIAGTIATTSRRSEAEEARPGSASAQEARAAEGDGGIAPASASADLEVARRARVLLRVGAQRVTVGELEDRLAAIPPYQRATFGASPEAIARAYVEQVLARDMLLAEGAAAQGKAKALPTSQLVSRALSSATLRNLRAPYPSAAAIPVDDVRRYYDENRSRFDSPERINLWRVLCATKDEAETVLAAARREPTIAKFNELAREHSLDKATMYRGGNLGFLGPDGASNEPGVKVDSALVQAAHTAKDGELVPRPVPEGENFAVVWRRGTVPANRRSLEESTAQIRAALYRERIELAEKRLMEELRAKNVKDVNVAILGMIELPPMDAGNTPARQAASSSSTPAREAPRAPK